MQPKLTIITTAHQDALSTPNAFDGYETCTLMAHDPIPNAVTEKCRDGDVCVLDLGDSLNDDRVLNAIVEVTRDAPVLVLLHGECHLQQCISALIRHFTHGKLDFLVPPFSTEQLQQKVAACLRLFRGDGSIHHSFSLDHESRSLKSENVEVELTRMEFNLMNALMSPVGRICTRDFLIERMHHDDMNVTDRSIDQHIKNLRKKLSQMGLPGSGIIRSVYGVGYQLNQIERNLSNESETQ